MYIVDFVKNLFRRANAGVIVYLVLNTVLYIALLGGFSSAGMAVFAVFLYLASLCVALSPAGELIMRLQNGCRKIKRRDYLDRLMPLFDAVYAQARARDPGISDKVQLFMSGSKSPNAFATGRKTICLTKGFMTYTDEQIMGTLAHEFAHLAHKDTDLLLLISVGNLLMSAVFIIWRIIVNIFVFFFATALHMRFIGTFLTSLFVNLLLTFFMWLWTKLGMLLVMHSSRQNEFEADAFAFELGYGDDLCVVLDSFDGGEDDGERRSLWSQLHDTHPSSDDRIAKLQDMGAGYRNQYGHDVRAVNANPEQYGYAHRTPPVAPPPGMDYQRPAPPPMPPSGPFGVHVPAGAAAFVNHSQTVAAGSVNHVPAAPPVAPSPGIDYQRPAPPPPPVPVPPPPPVPPSAHVSVGADWFANTAQSGIHGNDGKHICGHCSAEIAEDAKFCPQCGTPYTPPAPEPTPGAFCSQCGRTVERGAAFCAWCGAPIPGVGGSGTTPGGARTSNINRPAPPPPPPRR